MFKKFYPTVYVLNAYTVDFSEIYNKGYRVLILDVDNTLVEHGAPANEKAVAFFDYVHDLGFKTCILSNNSETRIKPFADTVKSDYIFDAGKPKRSGYEKAMGMLGGNKNNTLFMGDQLFTDIYGANRTGIKSILVKPIKIDPQFLIRLKRVGERIVLPFYFAYAKRYPKSL